MYLLELKEEHSPNYDLLKQNLKDHYLVYDDLKSIVKNIRYLDSWNIYRIDKMTPVTVHAVYMEEEIELVKTENN